MLRRYMPKSLYARVVLIVILPIFLIQSIVTYAFFDRHWELVSENLSANVAGQIALVTRLYDVQKSPEARRAVERYSLEDLDLNVRFEPGEKVPEKDKLSILDLYNKTLDKELDQRLDGDYWVNTVNWPAYVEVRVQLEDGYLVFFPLKDRVYATTGPIFVVWLVIATLLIGWVAIIFLRNQVRSILKLANAAEAFGRGRDAPDFRPTGATEVRRAGRAFIAMRERIKRHMKQRTAMLAGVSHDLKTPLTRMKLALAMQPETEDTKALKIDVDEMERMLEAYLDFARDLSTEEELKDIDLKKLVDEIAAGAARGGNTLAVTVESDQPITARRNALKRAVTNLVSNGFKYGTNVWLTVRRDDDATEFIIDDDGPGVAPEDRDNVFKPFVRLDEARGQNVSGVGLGLSVVRDVARSHGGEVKLDTAPQGGLRAVFRLPE
ncbi:MAG: ATP-binding protein [Pseudomonadota bacterium]